MVPAVDRAAMPAGSRSATHGIEVQALSAHALEPPARAGLLPGERDRGPLGFSRRGRFGRAFR